LSNLKSSWFLSYLKGCSGSAGSRSRFLPITPAPSRAADGQLFPPLPGLRRAVSSCFPRCVSIPGSVREHDHSTGCARSMQPGWGCCRHGWLRQGRLAPGAGCWHRERGAATAPTRCCWDALPVLLAGTETRLFLSPIRSQCPSCCTDHELEP